MIAGEAVITATLVILQVVVVWFMLKKDRLFPTLFFYQWIAIPVAFVLDIALVSAVLGVGVKQLLTAEIVSPSVAAFIVTGLWMWYVSKSVRVRNTFIDKARARSEIFS